MYLLVGFFSFFTKKTEEYFVVLEEFFTFESNLSNHEMCRRTCD